MKELTWGMRWGAENYLWFGPFRIDFCFVFKQKERDECL